MRQISRETTTGYRKHGVKSHVTTCRHVGGTPSVDKNRAKMKKSEHYSSLDEFFRRPRIFDWLVIPRTTVWTQVCNIGQCTSNMTAFAIAARMDVTVTPCTATQLSRALFSLSLRAAITREPYDELFQVNSFYTVQRWERCTAQWTDSYKQGCNNLGGSSPLAKMSDPPTDKFINRFRGSF